MTVAELRQALETLEAAGKAMLDVVFEYDIEINGSPFSEQEHVDGLSEVDAYFYKGWQKQSTGKKVIRLQ